MLVCLKKINIKLVKLHIAMGEINILIFFLRREKMIFSSIAHTVQYNRVFQKDSSSKI